MKKIFALLLVPAMLFTLAACDNSSQTTDPSTEPSQTTTEATGSTTDNTEETTGVTQAPTDKPTDEPTTAPTEETTAPPTQKPTETPTTQPTVCNHSWKAASCTEPKTCKTCGAREGSAAGHSWKTATCTAPKTCKTCGATEGSAAGHSWKTATCTAPKTCKTCGATEGSAVGHSWKNATCTAPKTCKTCGVTEGTVSHDMYRHKCRVCGYEDELLGSFDVSGEGSSVYAYVYKTAVDNEYALAFYGNGETRDFGTSGGPYYPLYEKIKHVEFGEGITRIGDYTLFSWGGWTIKSLKLPSTLIEIGECAFESVAFGDVEGGLQLPNSLVRICDEAFENANIGKLIIPDSVKYIGERAFIGAYIRHIKFGSGIQQIGEAAFSEQHKNAILDSLEKKIYKNGYYVGDENNPYYMLVGVSSSEISSLEIHPNTVIIYDYACCDCIFLKSVVIPNKVKIVGDDAFAGCLNLKTVTLGTAVEYLKEHAFYECNNLKTINIGNNLKFIGRCTFLCCSSLDEICYSGTYLEWSSIDFEEDWNLFDAAVSKVEERNVTLKCSDKDHNLVFVSTTDP